MPTVTDCLPGHYKLRIPQEDDYELAIRYEVPSQPAPPFAATSPYVAGEFVRPSVANGFTYLVTVAGTGGGSEPAWPTTLGATVVSGGVTFMAVGPRRLLDTTNWYGQLMVRDEVHGASLLFCSGANGRIQTGYSPGKWTPSTAWVVGQQVVPTVLNGWCYACVAAGTGGGSEPAWGVVEGGVTTDGAARWRLVASDAFVSNIRLALTVADTAPIDWAVGVYQLQLTNPTGVVTSLLYDDAFLEENLISLPT